MSEENQGNEAPARKKKRRKVWNDSRRETLVEILLTGPKDQEELFKAFREKEKYRGLTFERVIREARAIVKEATADVEQDFYVITLPPPKKKETVKPPTVADKRRALIERLAKKMTKKQKEKMAN